MKKWTYHHIFGALVFLSIVLCLLIGLMALLGITLRPASVRMETWVVICLFFGFTATVIWVTVWLLKSRDRHWKKAVAVLLLMVLWLMSTYFAFAAFVFSSTVLDSAVYTSPDGDHSICITHEAFLAVEWNNVYVITSPVTMRQAGSIGGGTSLSRFEIIWQTDCVQIIRGDNIVVVEFS